MNKSNYQFCNNCGKLGHVFHNCKKPITSSGIICVKKDNNQLKYLTICRKDTLGYVDFIRGKYPLYNKDYIRNIIDEMTDNEKHKLLTMNFQELWVDLWGSFIRMQYQQEEKISKQKFNQIKEGVYMFEKDFYNLESLINESETNWKTPEWGFPKGRRNYMETDTVCAVREFNEETGFNENDYQMIKNIVPYEEIFMGSNYKTYKHKYYLAIYKGINNKTDKFQKEEVSNMKWLSLNQCLEHIRPYNLEKKEIINNIDKILHKYSIIS
tara:strand:+ start:73 stop:876 length:804 start_codon:yes stop_codon:yes gene_type:complete